MAMEQLAEHGISFCAKMDERDIYDPAIAAMAKDICRAPVCDHMCDLRCRAYIYAKRAHDAGYRKMVLCKDCKYYWDRQGFAQSRCTLHGRAAYPNDFCSGATMEDERE